MFQSKRTGSEIIKVFSGSTQLCMNMMKFKLPMLNNKDFLDFKLSDFEFIMLLNVKFFGFFWHLNIYVLSLIEHEKVL